MNAEPLVTTSHLWALVWGGMGVMLLLMILASIDAAISAWTGHHGRRDPDPTPTPSDLADRAATFTEQATGRRVTARERALLTALYTPTPEPPLRDSFYDQETDR